MSETMMIGGADTSTENWLCKTRQETAMVDCSNAQLKIQQNVCHVLIFVDSLDNIIVNNKHCCLDALYADCMAAVLNDSVYSA